MLVLEGQGADYHGEAVNPRNLSLLELALGYHRAYTAFEATRAQTNGLQRHSALAAQAGGDGDSEA